jgi:hypothetical protein
MNYRDAETLSAYLDGQLSPAELARLEKRLEADSGLRWILADLKLARGLLHQLPQRRVPRNFTLASVMPKLRAPEPRLVPVLRFASVLASFVFLATLALNGLAPRIARSFASAPLPVSGMGGGIGGGPSATEVGPQSFAAVAPTGSTAGESPLTPMGQAAPTAAAPSGPTAEAPLPALAPFATGAPTTETTLGPTAEATLAPPEPTVATAAPPVEVAPKAGPPAADNALPAHAFVEQPPVPILWQVMLGAAALLCGGLGWYLHQHRQSSFRRRWLRK